MRHALRQAWMRILIACRLQKENRKKIFELLKINELESYSYTISEMLTLTSVFKVPAKHNNHKKQNIRFTFYKKAVLRYKINKR